MGRGAGGPKTARNSLTPAYSPPIPRLTVSRFAWRNRCKQRRRREKGTVLGRAPHSPSFAAAFSRNNDPSRM